MNPHRRLNAVVGQLNSSPVSASSQIATTSVSDGVQVITLNYLPVNSWNDQTHDALKAAYEQGLADPSVKAMVITGGIKGYFMAGADIMNIQRMQLESRDPSKAAAVKEELKKFIAMGNELFNRIESGPKPVVAAVNGIAFGGGCELAMACNARIAVKSSKFGLPELKLGIIPGLGGTQRLPRLIGLMPALDATLRSKTLNAAKAAKLGLADEVVAESNLIATASRVALEIASGKRKRVRALYHKRKMPDAYVGYNTVGMARRQIDATPKLRILPQTYGYLKAVEAGCIQDGEYGLKKETEVFSELALGPVAKSLVHIFTSQRMTTKLPGINPKTSFAKKVRTVAVLGGGTMGSGIAAVFLLRGYKVILKEINDKFLQAGVARIEKIVMRTAKKKKWSAEKLSALKANLSAELTYAKFGSVDLVIEAVIENVPLKQKIFQDLERVCPPHAILATNTSTINIDEIGKKTSAQDRIIGLHFFSPAHVMPLLEIVRTSSTSEAVIATSMELAKRIGKTGVVVGNCVGFVANRVFFPYGQAAGFLVDHGVDPYVIDKALLKFGMPMGCFQMADLSGIDIFSHVSGIINSAYGERCYNSTLGHKLAEAKRLGQKTGKGYYNYETKKTGSPDPAIRTFIEQARRDAGSPRSIAHELSEQDIIEMVLFPVVNECFRTVGENFAARNSDVDLVSIMGYGYPAHRGGVMFWAEEIGLKHVVARLRHFSTKYGAVTPSAKAFFAPCDFLVRAASRQ